MTQDLKQALQEASEPAGLVGSSSLFKLAKTAFRYCEGPNAFAFYVIWRVLEAFAGRLEGEAVDAQNSDQIKKITSACLDILDSTDRGGQSGVIEACNKLIVLAPLNRGDPLH